ncbi:unnamed protein product [Mycena citricolor]|uniref:Uncharacterized protein n=1 Tax=Mycena citricolor TaxID=2018698 RepID=A0AAD2GYG5_9AGAR|nr:unnamed protein product [Mycena citricolor]
MTSTVASFSLSTEVEDWLSPPATASSKEERLCASVRVWEAVESELSDASDLTLAGCWDTLRVSLCTEFPLCFLSSMLTGRISLQGRDLRPCLARRTPCQRPAHQLQPPGAEKNLADPDSAQIEADRASATEIVAYARSELELISAVRVAEASWPTCPEMAAIFEPEDEELMRRILARASALLERINVLHGSGLAVAEEKPVKSNSA